MISAVQGSNQNVYAAQSVNKKSETENISGAAALTGAAGAGETKETGSALAQPDMDTVEISDEGMASLLASQTAASSSASATSAAADTDESDDSSESSTEDLSQYTETQLKQMLENGEITQQQYNTEIASRQEESESSEE